jgi:hypothetical protein
MVSPTARSPRSADTSRVVAASRATLKRCPARIPRIGFTPDGSSLTVSDRADDALLELPVAGGEPMPHPSSGATPHGFDFTPDGTHIVTEAFGGTIGAAAASS